jgi:hypothetical protein
MGSKTQMTVVCVILLLVKKFYYALLARGLEKRLPKIGRRLPFGPRRREDQFWTTTGPNLDQNFGPGSRRSNNFFFEGSRPPNL